MRNISPLMVCLLLLTGCGDEGKGLTDLTNARDASPEDLAPPLDLSLRDIQEEEDHAPRDWASPKDSTPIDASGQDDQGEDTRPQDGDAEEAQDVPQDAPWPDLSLPDSQECINIEPGVLIFTEVMAITNSPDAQWVELYSFGLGPVNLEGWRLETDGGSAMLGEAWAQPGAFAVLAGSTDPDANGGIVNAHPLPIDIQGAAFLRLVSNTDMVIDEVPLSLLPMASGRASSLDPAGFFFMANDEPSLWCLASTPYRQGSLGTPAEANPICPEEAQCGNSIVETEERCDDGANGNNDDGCRDDCRFTCEDPSQDCLDTPGDCRSPICEAVHEGQVCATEADDKDIPAPQTCRLAECREGQPHSEPLEDGYPCEAHDPGSYCLAGLCGPPECGDHVRGPLEQCDDGNHDPGDGCSPDCTLERCGNDILDPGEDCDDGANGNNDDGCRDDCRFTCEDPQQDCLNTPGDCQSPLCEAVDEGQLCATEADDRDIPAPPPCWRADCHDGQPRTEPLDDGYPCDAHDPGSYCLAGLCVPPECGDHVRGPLEQCDDGNHDPGDGCSPDCTLERCGDGEPDPGESCDDGANGNNDDGCRDDCRFTCEIPSLDCPDTPHDCRRPICAAVSGGQICASEADNRDVPASQPCWRADCREGQPHTEPLDDGAACEGPEPGSYCVAGLCGPPDCGDHVRGPLEQCDDGNHDPGDGCSPDCTLERCGNDLLDPGESCDDGANGDNDDGCRDDCRFTCEDPQQDCPDAPGDCRRPLCASGGEGQVCREEADDQDIPDTLACCLTECLSGTPHSEPLEDGYPCDAGEPGGYCVAGLCGPPECGDGIRGPLEECDSEPGCGIECTWQATCPEEMLMIPANPDLGVNGDFCMDIWEASRPDANDVSPGLDASHATSRPHVRPWVNLSRDDAAQACLNAGKRLCRDGELERACRGPEDTNYCYGNDYSTSICNGIDAYCQDPYAGCGLVEYNFRSEATETFPLCTNGYGIYDINGNYWEWSEEGLGHGGAYNCSDSAALHLCSEPVNWGVSPRSNFGFRCCRDMAR